MLNAEQEAKRRKKLSDIAVSVEQKQTYATQAVAERAQYQRALANLDQARVNLQRAVIRSPVNCWVTNLLAQRGDYATEGQNVISVADSDSFWVDGYSEETSLDPIHIGDLADIKLMGFPQVVRGHVDSIARAINVANAQPNGEGVATVNPIFTWVRLVQQIPVRIHIDQVPQAIVLTAGMTTTVQIDAGPRPRPKIISLNNHGEPAAAAARTLRYGNRLSIALGKVDLRSCTQSAEGVGDACDTI
jgi:multidrug resistance efflux pump